MAWGDVARRQSGVVTAAQLCAAGVTREGRRHLAGTGALTCLARGVYLTRGTPLTLRARLWAAVLGTGGAVGFTSATHQWAMVDVPPPWIDIVLGHDRRVTIPPGVRLLRVVPLRPDTVQTLERLPITTRTASAVDHLSRLRLPEAARFTDRALQRSWLTLADLDRRLRLEPGRRGNGRIREVLRHCADGAAAESERRLHGLLRRAGVRGWVANYRVRTGARTSVVVDVAFPALRLAIEVDGWAYHSDVDRFQADRTKQNALTALGWTVLRFTWADLTERPREVLAQIVGQLARVS